MSYLSGVRLHILTVIGRVQHDFDVFPKVV